MTKEYDKAIEKFSAMHELDCIAKYYLGKCFEKKGDLSIAKEYFRQVLSADMISWDLGIVWNKTREEMASLE